MCIRDRTTTPWTIPGNRAIAYSAEINYSMYKVESIAEHSTLRVGDKIIFADELLENVKTQCKLLDLTRISEVKDFGSFVCDHPFRKSGYNFDVKLYDADFVTLEQGTGFVHIAPGHGADDYILGTANNIDVPDTVDENGEYFDHVPLFNGKKIFNEDGSDADANIAVIIELKKLEN